MIDTFSLVEMILGIIIIILAVWSLIRTIKEARKK